MLNRINQLFQDSPKNLLSIYFCAGCPTLDGTADVIRALERNGVSMIEIGIPFSDPMADGIVIQNAATRALHNGMSLRLLFEQLRDIRRDVRIPLILMGYLNPIMQFGFEAFCQKCVECDIDGVIIPDLPFRDYEESYKAIASKYDIRVIMLITPETSEARVREIDAHTDGKENLITAIEIAAAKHPDGTPIVPEVCIFFENELMRGNRTTKINAENFNAFRSFNYPPLAKAGIQIR